MTLHEEIQHIGANLRCAMGEKLWKVTDPARVMAGYVGVTFHRTEAEAAERVRMFPGSFMARA